MSDPITPAVEEMLGPNEPPAVSRRLFLTCPDCHGYGYQLHGRHLKGLSRYRECLRCDGTGRLDA